MAVLHLAAFRRRGHRQVDRHRLQRRRLRFGFRQRSPGLVAGDTRFVARRAPAVDGDLRQVAQLACEVLDVRARAAIYLGWIFAREQRDLVSLGHGILEAEWIAEPERTVRPGPS